ncbi:hypothetical protein GWN42_09835, partial [candidate division KSB1 bacterium]|nr:hypothetical protein [candidate division KSB1 bacterium]
MMYVYVIMPVGSDPKYSNKRDIIKKVAKEVNIDVYIPSGVNNPLDMDFTIEKLKNAKSVIADLSFERPSCYYELGIAQAFGKRVFLLAEEGTRIHQSKNRE